MARYIGPKLKISRRFGTKLGLRSNEEAFTRRPYKPGQHGPQGRRGRISEYGSQLMEKQKAKYIYGILERQFHNYYQKASQKANSGLVLLQLLETRLDSLLYRAGLTTTQNQARQFVSHGHVTVNGRKVGIPSYQVEVGMKVELDPKLYELILSNGGVKGEIPAWIQVDKNRVEMLSLPTRGQIPSLVDEQLIVEFYSR